MRTLYDLSRYKMVGESALECWYTTPNTGTAMTTGAPSANYLRVIPYVVPSWITIDRIAINVTSYVAGNARIGLYRDNGNCYPGQAMVDLIMTIASNGIRAGTVTIALEPGLYWLAYLSNSASTIRCLAVSSIIPILGVDSSLGTAWSVGYVIAQSYGALPNPFPAGASKLTAVPIPAIFVRIASED